MLESWNPSGGLSRPANQSVSCVMERSGAGIVANTLPEKKVASKYM